MGAGAVVTPRAIVLHTVGVRGDTAIDAIRRYHVDVLGWRDVGYHYLVRRDGTLQSGRAPDELGAHTSGANDTIGLCVAGDGDSEPWTQAQWRTVLAVCDRPAYRGLPVLGHREAPARLAGARPTDKTCPGRLVDLGEVRAEVARFRRAGRGGAALDTGWPGR